MVTLASPYLEVALSGCLLFLQLFLEGGYEKNFFSGGPQLCMLKNIHETYHWKAMNDNKVMVANRHLMNN